jgi:peptide-methionine (S)-S-oxide reductase
LCRGLEKFFKQEFGSAIIEASVGYTGGHAEYPTYEQVCQGSTGHAEAFRFEFDPQKVRYEALVEYLFRMHDPTTLNRQVKLRLISLRDL